MNRLHALTDGVYAIAMTLLVLELHVPDAIVVRARLRPGHLARSIDPRSS